MTDEHTILNHYNLSNPFPTSWPTEKDDSDASDDEKSKGLSRHYVRRSRSRYSALERNAHDRKSLVPGSEKLPHGQENLVQKDEPDPLGGGESVVRILRKQGLPVEENSQLRNRFLLSSTTFSPNAFLAQVHSQASPNELVQGLESLSRSIDSKSASLKVLVESNFERFVRAKTTIDNVYAEMRNQGAEAEPHRSPGHSRVASRESRHFRDYSGQGQGLRSPSKGINGTVYNDKKKNALTKESEYGVLGIKAPLIEVAVKAGEIWGPALGGQEREGSLKEILDSVESCQDVFKITNRIRECIKRRDYDGLVERHSKARKYVDDARQIADRAGKHQQNLSDPQVNQLMITATMWSNVQDQLEDFKRDVWRRLTNVQMSTQSSMSQTETEEHMPLISVLLELGVDDNPIWVWLLSRYDYLKSKINATFERSRVEIEVLRRRLANAEPPTPIVVANHLRSCMGKEDDKLKRLDTLVVLELWDLIYDSLEHLLSMKTGILGEVIEFWDKAQAFMEGKIQKTLPIGIDGRSRKHHRLSKDGTRDLQNGVVELIGMLQEYVFAFFADPPIEDVSLLYSPSPNTSTANTPLSPYARQDARFRFDENNPPPSSPRRGETWEDFAFWPPYANCLSGVHYLEKLLTLLGSAACEMAGMDPVAQGRTLPEKLKMTVAGARERSLKAACVAWGKDADALKHLEDWSRTSEHPELTQIPDRLNAFETTLLSGMQKILYIPEAANAKSSAAGILSPPAAKLVEMVRTQFLTSLYKALSGMVEIAERTKPTKPTGLGIVTTGLDNADTSNGANASEDGSVKRNIRLLLTLCNMKYLQSTIIPSLTSQFETHFSLPIDSESTQLRDALSQIYTRLFDSYTKPTKLFLFPLIENGIASPDWLPTTPRPNEVRPYVYHALLHLVAVHAEVSTTTNPSSNPEKLTLTNSILSSHLEEISRAFLSAFKKRQTYPLPALMQATLDVEFVAQTMSQYTSPVASERQSEIYVELDRKTTREASGQLQGELPEMRKVLKGLREGTRGEFGCFRKVKGVERGRERERSL